MKTASMVLGIVGGALKIFGALILLLISGIMFPAILSSVGRDIQNVQVFNLITTIYNILAIPLGIGGILGLIGGLIVKKNNTTGGILMIIGTVLGLDVLLLLGSIFAFIKEKQPVPPYPYPPYPYPPYPGQQPYVPQNPTYPGGGQNPPKDNG